ncbi:MAG: Rrf2 family transcriptional regulator [Ignavibacteriales bacterium]|nr:Rrf2 family transcriptional regulator [Ignavibacteriales bacterium]
MSIIFSRQCEYALQAVLFLALKPQGEKTSIKELTKHLDLPYHFAAKILQSLSRKGLLLSYKGSLGGFALKKSVNEITLYQIVEAVDGLNFMQGCVLGFSECGNDHPCALHERWGKMRDELKELLTIKSISQFASEMEKPQYKKRT